MANKILMGIKKYVVENINKRIGIIMEAMEISIEAGVMTRRVCSFREFLQKCSKHTMDPVMEEILYCSISSSRVKPLNEIPLQIQYFLLTSITLVEPICIVLETS
jgi:hypothetical protein